MLAAMMASNIIEVTVTIRITRMKITPAMGAANKFPD
jgi:hypothetical protein